MVTISQFEQFIQEAPHYVYGVSPPRVDGYRTRNENENFYVIASTDLCHWYMAEVMEIDCVNLYSAVEVCLKFQMNSTFTVNR